MEDNERTDDTEFLHSIIGHRMMDHTRNKYIKDWGISNISATLKELSKEMTRTFVKNA
jgi:hypothetical protein